MANNREICALDRHSKAMEDFTATAKSKGGREIREERLAIEKTIANKKLLDEADRVLDEARVTIQKEIVDHRAKIVTENAAARAVYDARKADLNDLETKLASRASIVAGREDYADNTVVELHAREVVANAREVEADKAAKLNVDLATANEERVALLDARETELDAREAKFKVAMS